jgi:hypothetical protein
MNNEGGQPFLFPGKVPGFEKVFPDVDRINPEYFKYLDRKIDYLNEQGFVPFIEVSRRDASECWKKYYSWPDSYSRFIEYIWSRYQANNTVLSPIHLDIIQESITVPDFVNAIDLVMKKYGPPPFGTLLSANANPSTLVNWGENSWVTLHQVGNKREHEYYWYMTEIFRDPQARPALNGERGLQIRSARRDGEGRSICALGNVRQLFVWWTRRARLRRRRNLGRRYRARCSNQDVGCISVELGRADEVPAHLRVLDRETLPGAGSG